MFDLTGNGTALEAFRRLLPVSIAVFTIILLFLDGRVALYAGVIYGISLVILATLISIRHANQ